ncbi:CCR4-NOT regulatory complex component, partial [Dinochytrium kinnereticum]
MPSDLTLTQAVRAHAATLPHTDQAVEVTNLDFSYGAAPILQNVSLILPKASRTLLIGANGAGKSTLLKLLAGKTLVKGGVRVRGKNPFFESAESVTYLGTEWAHNPIVRRDVPVSRLLKSLGAERHPERCERLLEIMDVDVNWHMHEVSDGQRRRVQIVLGLLEPWDVLLLDEVTVDLDVLVRRDLLDFLLEETQRRQATIVYATHIFDGLGGWPSHVVHIRDGTIVRVRELLSPEGFPELEEARKMFQSLTPEKALEIRAVDNSPLLRVVEAWLREDYKIRKERILKSYGQEKPKTKWELLSENMKETPTITDEEDDDEDIILSDEDMDLVDEYGDQFSFLMNLDPKALEKGSKEKKEAALAARLKPPPIEDDGFDMVQVRSDDSSSSDSDQEHEYEMKPRVGAGWGAKAPERLPLITPEGKVVRVKGEVVETRKEEVKKGEGETKKKKEVKVVTEVEGGVEEGMAGVVERKKSTKQIRVEAQEQMAALASSLMENPEEHINKLKPLRELGKTTDPILIKLCLLTQLTVYRDIIPGYRIRPLTDVEKQQKVSKDVKKLRNYEEGLVSNYQAYLQQLERLLRHHLGKDKKGDTTSRDASIATCSARCLTELLTTVTHFNFRINLLTAVVGHMATRSPPEIGVMCCNAVKRIFAMDVTGETSLEAVRLVARFVKVRGFVVPAEVLGTFLHLRLREELGPVAEEGGEGTSRKRKGEEKVHRSKKMRKVAKLEKEVEKELKEAEAEVDLEERKRKHTETLKLVFTTYFRVLKGAKDSPLLPVVLDGLSRFAHLINIDFFADLIKVLKEITVELVERYREGEMGLGGVESALCCVVAAYRILSGQGEAINIDLKDFNSSLYSQLLRLTGDPMSSIPKTVGVNDEGGSKVRHVEDERKRSAVELALLGIDLSFNKKKQ